MLWANGIAGHQCLNHHLSETSVIVKKDKGGASRYLYCDVKGTDIFSDTNGKGIQRTKNNLGPNTDTDNAWSPHFEKSHCPAFEN